LRSVGTLAAGAAHEINTPLSTIGLRVRRVARRHTDEETVRDLEVIRDQLDRCARIVDQLLIGAGDPSAAGLERGPLSGMVGGAITLWSQGCDLDVVVDDEIPTLMVELPRIAFCQGLINLLENARQAQEAVDSHQPLEITLFQRGQNLVLRLRDHGCGLPDGAEQVGDPFFTTKPNGTGLGVFVARQVADGAGGGLALRKGDGYTDVEWWVPEAPRRSDESKARTLGS
jgi:two-component system sensor histidine kinase RegB